MQAPWAPCTKTQFFSQPTGRPLFLKKVSWPRWPCKIQILATLAWQSPVPTIKQYELFRIYDVRCTLVTWTILRYLGLGRTMDGKNNLSSTRRSAGSQWPPQTDTYALVAPPDGHLCACGPTRRTAMGWWPHQTDTDAHKECFAVLVFHMGFLLSHK